MRTSEEVRERVAAFQHAKEQFLCPPVLISQGGVEVVGPACTLESLNAEIAALTWMLGKGESSSDEVGFYPDSEKP